MDWQFTTLIICAVLTLMNSWILQPVLSKTSKSVSSSLDLQCPSCDRIHCTPKRAKRLKCKGGITRGICNCCPVCAKTQGESCGGDWNYLGKCDRGLFCKPSLGQEFSKNKLPEGTCQRVPGHQSDEGLPAYCQPKCTPDFCKKNPKAICAAVDNADKKQDCQGDCQHTSCGACRFVQESTDCVKCRKDDFSCMKRFAKCIKKRYCSKSIFPCRRKNSIYEEGAIFKCLVAECLLP